MYGLEDLCDLFFELSNEDRLRILLQLDREAMNITNLSKKLDLTTQECSRHVSRLGDVGLIQKDIEGLHHVSPYGELILEQLPGLEFISKNRHYFITHTLRHLPPDLLLRLGDLAESTYIDDVMVAFHKVEIIIQEAEEYLWNFNDQYIASTFPMARKAFERGVKGRSIDPKDVQQLHPLLLDAIMPEDRQAIVKARRTGSLEERMLEKIEAFLWMNEKEVMVAFPAVDGRFDYLGFTSKDERAHRWCKDLFQYYWERSQPRTQEARPGS